MGEIKGSVAKCFCGMPLSHRERVNKMTYWLNGDAAGVRACDTASPSCHTAIA